MIVKKTFRLYFLGLYFPSSNEFVTTVTELIAFDTHPRFGSHQINESPKKGTITPAETGKIHYI